MIRRFPALRPVCLAALLFGLAACEDSEDRAARHLENAEALVAEGDPGAAMLEFRNVLEYDPTNRAALSQLAYLQMEAGAENAAYGLYQRLVENHPDATQGWLSLSEIAIRRNLWDEAATFAERAVALAPDSDRTALIMAALDFRTAVEAGDATTAAASAAVARRHLEGQPDDLIARQILITEAGSFRGPEALLTEIDAALAELPDLYLLHQMKVQTLAELGRADAVGPALEAMTTEFPDNPEALQALIDWYMQRGDADAVERVLRARAGDAEADFSDRLTLMNFLREVRGVEPALAEIDSQIAALSGADSGADTETEGDTREVALLRGLRATLMFESGAPDAAIAELESVIDTLPEGEEANDLRVALARILLATGEEAAAMARIDTVLAQDSGHVEAAKIKAARLIGSDETDAAVSLLRQAQATAPQDADVVRLMGDAHARAGNWDLAGERYATALDLAGGAPREALVYARFLLERGQPDTAETVLVDALRVTPTDAALLELLTEIHLAENDFDAARRGIARLRGLNSDAARRTAEALEGTLLLREDRTDEVLSLVQQMAAEGRGDAETLAALIRAKIADGEVAEATALLDAQLEAYPDDPLLHFLRGGLHLIEGDIDAAEAVYRDILADFPAAVPPLRVLYGLLVQQGRDGETQALLEEVRAAVPEAPLPRLLLAERAQIAGDAETAITLYEELYAQDGSNLIVANNLASLLMARADDAEAVARASTITRRLRGTEIPAFQDTYGWLAYLRGEYQTALEYLEPAAAALPEEPSVQYHLGMTYLALERTEDARTTLERALALAGEGDLPAAARTALEGL